MYDKKNEGAHRGYIQPKIKKNKFYTEPTEYIDQWGEIHMADEMKGIVYKILETKKETYLNDNGWYITKYTKIIKTYENAGKQQKLFND